MHFLVAKHSAEDDLIVSYGIGGKEHAFSKEIDEIKVGNFSVQEYKLDFTTFQYEDINGLLGLDILTRGGFTIDLKNLELYQKEF